MTDLLEEDGTHAVVGSASTFDAALAAITLNQPDIAVIDTKLEQGAGIDVLAEAKRRVPGLLGIVVSNDLPARDRRAAINAVAAYVRANGFEVERLAAVV
jgi:DNA-binding NarL/FixJ family response regulator